MVFSSLVFIWLFLPVVLVGYFLMPAQLKNVFLLIFSLLFYAWGEPECILLMIFLILVNYIIGIIMERNGNKRKTLLILSIVINIAILGYFKYFNFFIQIVSLCIGKEIEIPEITLPIGISFFTFQIMSYIIDLYRGKYHAQKNLINLALYISFFPQLIAGPIVRYEDINVQLGYREHTLEKTASGIRRFMYGFGKKIILANTAAQCVDTIFALEYSELTGALAWAGAVLYTLQIYYDFSGYSDMAIGLGRIFGFDFVENFNYPYMAVSIQEFWQRWHISLGTWFKEYLYIPLGGNRKGKVRTYINLIIVFFLTGMWHGASFNFILWGLYHGCCQIIERIKLKSFLFRHKIFAHVYTAMVFIFGWVIFRADHILHACVIFRRMLLPWEYTENQLMLHTIFSYKTMFVIVTGILGSGLVQQFSHRTGLLAKWKNSYMEIVDCGIVFILCIAMLASNTYNPFIYFRF